MERQAKIAIIGIIVSVLVSLTLWYTMFYKEEIKKPRITVRITSLHQGDSVPFMITVNGTSEGVEGDPNLRVYLLVYPRTVGGGGYVNGSWVTYQNGWWVNPQAMLFSGGNWSGNAAFGFNEEDGSGDIFDLAIIVTKYEYEPFEKAYGDLPPYEAVDSVTDLVRK